MKNLANEYALFGILQPRIIRRLYKLKHIFENYNHTHDKVSSLLIFDVNLFFEYKHLESEFSEIIRPVGPDLSEVLISQIIIKFSSANHHEKTFKVQISILDNLTLAFIIKEQDYSCVHLKKDDIIPIENFSIVLNAIKEIEKYYL